MKGSFRMYSETNRNHHLQWANSECSMMHYLSTTINSWVGGTDAEVYWNPFNTLIAWPANICPVSYTNNVSYFSFKSWEKAKLKEAISCSKRGDKCCHNAFMEYKGETHSHICKKLLWWHLKNLSCMEKCLS